MRTFTRVPRGPFWRSNARNMQPHHGVQSAEGPIHTDPADRVSAGPVRGPWPHPAPVSRPPRGRLSPPIQRAAPRHASPRTAQAPSDSGPIGRTGDRCPTGRGEERGQPGCSAGPRVAPPPTAAPGHVRASGRRCQLDARRPSPCPSRDHALHCGGHRDGARSRPRDPGHVGAGGRLCDGDAVRAAGRVSCRPRRSPEKWHPGLSPLLWHRALVDGDGVGAGTGASPRGQAVPRSRGLQPDCLRERAPKEAAPAAVSLGAGWAGATARGRGRLAQDPKERGPSPFPRLAQRGTAHSHSAVQAVGRVPASSWASRHATPPVPGTGRGLSGHAGWCPLWPDPDPQTTCSSVLGAVVRGSRVG